MPLGVLYFYLNNKLKAYFYNYQLLNSKNVAIQLNLSIGIHQEQCDMDLICQPNEFITKCNLIFISQKKFVHKIYNIISDNIKQHLKTLIDVNHLSIS